MKIVWSREARTDLGRIQSYLLEHSPTGAERIWTRITQRVAELEQFPESGRISLRPGLRELVITRTPYIVFYQIDVDVIRIQAVFHGRQNR